MKPKEWTPDLRFQVARLLVRQGARLGDMIEKVMCAKGSYLCLPREQKKIDKALDPVGQSIDIIQEGLNSDDF